MMKSGITRLSITVLSTVAMVAIPVTQVRAADYWNDKSITENVVVGDRLVGQVRLPDWDNITLEDFPPMQEGGSIGTEFNSYASYDLSRGWVAGDSLVDILKLGDVEEGFAAQELSIGEIAVFTEIETSDVALSAFELAKEQSLGELVEAVPGLGQQQVSEVESSVSDEITGYFWESKFLFIQPIYDFLDK